MHVIFVPDLYVYTYNYSYNYILPGMQLPHKNGGSVPGTSSASERSNHGIPEYNGLHDPHTKSYFYQPHRVEKLIKNG